MIKLIKHTFFILLLAGLQLGMVALFPANLGKINVLIVVLIFISMVGRFSIGTTYAFILGVILDLYSALPFGALLVSLLLTMYVAYKIFVHFLTNKSLYTLVGLTVISTIVYNAFLYMYTAVNYLIKVKDYSLINHLTVNSINDLLWQILFNLVLSVLLFAVFNLFSRRFKAVFIDTTKQ
ncbi:rod shape-determining protein MreD [Candidatus Falkowbacteria bacterium]|jgi:cell shape-determining protein MreD|nr:rod shape-determining protein MreD [Candidatus Falkowbacteria bacterium]MBT5503508.1 rod shape-determining protein MreD [Candidatus Falkowbacteria bacterium]MBT6573980.1 rod shape-determining protein MreD [Candidatus Falkowbacteria bacterium]MBT7348201.1 rod shape-determining protein MreD [Candidatus Falkowbacteria bacterium]MBT7500180.1 rod shape-determining protein MreD [Candidatus Falkowbacteria bacterium]